MKPDDPNEPDQATLRQRAEAELRRLDAAAPEAAGDVLRLVHELRVHQIELEMQNETLREARSGIEDALRQVTGVKEQLEDLVTLRTAELHRANDQALAASRAKATFLGMMSHELRTPMNGILGMVELARRRSGDPKIKEQLEKALQSGRHLLEIIDDVLDVAQLSESQLVLASHPVQLDRLIRTLRETIEPAVLAKGLTLRTELAPELAGRVFRGDALRLGQILLNLTSNAVQFTSAGEVSVSGRIVAAQGDAVRVRFEVRDTGIGIPPDSAKDLFEPFVQLDGSNTRAHGGAGLGLAISRQLARLMGGDIGVESAPGKGSLFWVEVRLAWGLSDA